MRGTFAPRSGERRTEPSGLTRRAAVALAAVLAVLLGLGGWVFWELELDPYLQNGFLPGAAGFGFSGPAEKVTPGSVGCRAIVGDVCYSTSFVTAYTGRDFSSLRFLVSNYSAPDGPPLPLGPGAMLSIVSPESSPVAVWNVSSGTWVAGGSEGIPQNTNVPLVLDTGLRSNSTLSDAWLWGFMEGWGSGVELNPS